MYLQVAELVWQFVHVHEIIKLRNNQTTRLTKQSNTTQHNSPKTVIFKEKTASGGTHPRHTAYTCTCIYQLHLNVPVRNNACLYQVHTHIHVVAYMLKLLLFSY